MGLTAAGRKTVPREHRQSVRVSRGAPYCSAVCRSGVAVVPIWLAFRRPAVSSCRRVAAQLAFRSGVSGVSGVGPDRRLIVFGGGRRG